MRLNIINLYIYNVSLQRETSIIYMLNNLEKNQEKPYIPIENTPISYYNNPFDSS